MNQEFIDTYGVVGYYLRKLDINTPSRIAMLSSLLHLQDDQPVDFKEFYDFSLEQTGEKLETSSFSTLITKLEDATGLSDPISNPSDKFYLCSNELVNAIKQAKRDFDRLTSGLS